MSLNDAFNTLLQLSQTSYVYERPGEVDTFNVNASISNYSRNIDGPEEIIMEGREYVISAKEFEGQAFTFPKRGDRLISATSQENVIGSVMEMRGMKGELLGYRVRTN
jgi:hypothetical protein